MIQRAALDDYARIEDIWWDSVQATHQFIEPSYLENIKHNLQSDYLPQVQLFVWRDRFMVIQGFIGWSDSSIEMLFVHPDASGRGIGKELANFAIEQGNIQVDVNEANFGALAFYKKQGFEVFGRSDLDGAGMPYPILHLRLGSDRTK
jgi:putative acetyltransferase